LFGRPSLRGVLSLTFRDFRAATKLGYLTNVLVLVKNAITGFISMIPSSCDLGYHGLDVESRDFRKKVVRFCFCVFEAMANKFVMDDD
jgi:hypothetical protein